MRVRSTETRGVRSRRRLDPDCRSAPAERLYSRGMEERRRRPSPTWTLALTILGSALCVIAALMAADYLSSPRDPLSIAEEKLSFQIDPADLVSDTGAKVTVFISHDFRSDWENVIVSFQPAPTSDVEVGISHSPGGIEGPAWLCGPGPRATNEGTPGDKQILSDRTTVVSGLAAPRDESSAAPESTYIDGRTYGVACQRTGELYERQPRGLVYVSPTGISIALTADGEAPVSVSEKLELPSGWSLSDVERVYTAQSTGAVKKDGDSGSQPLATGGQDAGADTAFRVRGLHVIQDAQVTREVERLAWTSAILAGAGIGLLTAVAGLALEARSAGPVRPPIPVVVADPAPPVRPRSGGGSPWIVVGAMVVALAFGTAVVSKRRER